MLRQSVIALLVMLVRLSSMTRVVNAPGASGVGPPGRSFGGVMVDFAALYLVTDSLAVVAIAAVVVMVFAVCTTIRRPRTSAKRKPAR